MLQIGIFDSSSGSLYLDISPRASNVVLVNGEHGFGTLTCFVKMSIWEAFMLYDRPGIPHIQVTEYGLSVWEGRLEDVKIVAGGVQLTALGYWRALSDFLYTALWSASSVTGWRPITVADLASRDPQMYVMDTNNRLYISPVKGAVFANLSNVGGYTFAAPNGGARTIVALSFNYSVLLPNNWRIEIARCADDFSGRAVIQNIATTGILQTGTVTQTFTGSNRLEINIYNNTGGASTPAGETGINFLTVTTLRVKTTTSANVYADEIATALAANVNASNPAQLSASAALINSPTVDLTDETYQDARHGDILDHLAKIGDNSTPVALFETGVWDKQLLSFQKRGLTAKVWYVDISALELERTIDQLYNYEVANYQEASGRTLRTAASSDADSLARYGVLRQRAVQAQTTNLNLANTERDVALQDGKDPLPRIRISFEHVYDGAGSLYPLWMVRAWDTIVLRNLPATLNTSLDRIRQFRCIEARYHVDSDTLTVTPESRIPSLDTFLARQAAGAPNKLNPVTAGVNWETVVGKQKTQVWENL